ncbi:MAG: hypothetical protein LC748_00955, partial [Thermomicrobia bacterium]|nr:hypothetical protein [Thermomicrobia bacterium]
GTAAGTVGAAPATGATIPVGGTAFNGTPATIGVPVVFSGSGFNANEGISLWTTAPDSSVGKLPGISADTTGAFTTTVTFPSAGNWQVTAQAPGSTHQVIGRYAVSDTATTTAPAPPFTSPFAGTAMKATVGTTVAFTSAGFIAGETVSAWVTPPDGSAVIAIKPTVTASAAGQATVSTSFTSVGLWQITMHGLTSGHEVIGSYQVTTS